MYKLSDAAIKLNIEKVYLFELLMTKSEVLNEHVVKEYGVTYISDKGLQIIDDIIHGREITSVDKNDGVLIADENKVSFEPSLEVNFEPSLCVENNKQDDGDFKNTVLNNQEEDKAEDNKLYSKDKSEILSKGYSEEKSLDKNSNVINEDKKIGNQTKAVVSSEIDCSDNVQLSYSDEELEIDYTIIKEKTRLSFYEREHKKKKILELRSQLIELDSEIKRKSEAVESYDKILEEDIQWICILEDRLSAKISDMEEVVSGVSKETSQRNLLDKLFMKK